VKYRVYYKRWSELKGQLMLVEDEIEASNYVVNEIGAVTFFNDLDQPTLSIPPGLWLPIEPADTPKETSLVLSEK
jgi:hypothetical protein